MNEVVFNVTDLVHGIPVKTYIKMLRAMVKYSLKGDCLFENTMYSISDKRVTLDCFSSLSTYQLEL